MLRRFHQLLLITSILWLSWLMMMLVHECGHVLGGFCSGGTVRHLVWHPAVISRTDVEPNPHPLLEVWAGPIVGSIVPVVVAQFSTYLRLRVAYLVWSFAGFCLIANGAYIGIGSVKPVGDALELIDYGMPRWPMSVFGIIEVAAGLWIWHRVSPRFGFGARPVAINARHAYTVFGLAILTTAIGFAFGHAR